MRLSVGEAAPHRRTDPGCDVGIECVHVEADVHEPRPRHMCQCLAHGPFDSEPIDVAHREHARVEVSQYRSFALVE